MTKEVKGPRTVEKALERLITASGKALQHGQDLAFTLKIDDLDVRVTIAPRRAALPAVDIETIAFETLERGGYLHDGCAANVKDRSTWSRSSKRKQCQKPIAYAIARKGRRWDNETSTYKDGASFVTFACRIHKDAEAAEADVIGVLAVSKIKLKIWQARIAERRTERARFAQMTEEEKIAADAKAAGHPEARVIAAELDDDVTDKQIERLLPWIQQLAASTTDLKTKRLCDLALRLVDDRHAASVYGEAGIFHTIAARVELLELFRRWHPADPPGMRAQR